MRIFGLKEAKFIGIVGVLALAVFLPFFAFGNTKTIYVDDNASGMEDGSKANPYKKIGTALKHADEDTDVRVQNGSYHENITIPKGVSVIGDDGNRSKVTIDGDKNDPTVTMKHDSKLSNVTVKDGRHGIRVLEDSKAHVYNVLVDGADRDGIHADSASRDKKHRLYLDKVEVKGSGKAGIYSEKRFIVVVNSYLRRNDSDGMDFQPGTDAWVEDTRIYENGGTGWKVVMDGSEIWSKDNQFRRNGREGIQIESFDGTGKFGAKKSKFVDNARYGVAILARTGVASSMWKNIFLEKNDAWGNRMGNVSPVIGMYR